MILDHLIRVLHVAPHLPAEFGRHVFAFQFGPFLGLLLHIEVYETGEEDLHGDFTVLGLRPLVLHRYDEFCRKVREPDGSRVFLNALTTVAACAEDIYAQVVGVNFDLFRFVGLGQDLDESKAGVTAVVGVERRKPDEPVDATFRTQITVGVLAVDPDGGTLYPGFVARRTGTDPGDVFMMLHTDTLRIVHTTLHVSVRTALEQIDTDAGAFFVPREVAGVWGQSVEEIEEEAEELYELKREPEPEPDATLKPEEAERELVPQQPEPSAAIAVEPTPVAVSLAATIYRQESERSHLLLQREMVKVRYELTGKVS